MGKPKGPNQKAKYKALNARLDRYTLLVKKIYDTYNLEAAKIATSVNYDGEKPFSFADYPTTKKRVQDLLNGWKNDMFAVINKGTASEWANSNAVQDLLADKALWYYYGREHGRRKRKYYQTNPDSLVAFQTRVDKGMNLSQKIWEQSKGYKEDLESALSSGIQKGMSAVTLSKRVSKYLVDFDSLRADYKEKYGKETDALNCEYRSMRLARSEINMAYRSAEQLRWKQFDFVKAKEIKLSKSHHDRMPGGDICDDLAGIYPKEIDWTGWHPNDMCYVVPVLKTEEEFFSDEEVPNEQIEFPSGFDNWVNKNIDRLSGALDRNTLPYWIRDNKDVKDCIRTICNAREVGDTLQGYAEAIAEKYGCSVTPINYKKFSSLYRKLTNPIDPTPIGDIKDAVRNTIVAPKEAISSVIDELKKVDGFIRHKPQSTDFGYTGNIINVRFPNGVIGEIQVNTPQMIYAKDSPSSAKRVIGEELWNKIHNETGLEGGLGHKFYEQGRVTIDTKKLDEIIRKSKEYYKHFS